MMDHTQMSELLDSVVEAAEYLCGAMERQETAPTASEVLSLLHQAAAVIARETEDTDHVLGHVHLYGKNIQASIDDLQNRPMHRRRIAHCEIRPFALEMRRLWHYATEILPYPGRRAAHLKEQMAASEALHKAAERGAACDVSIILFGYNKLEYTQKAVESIFAHTNLSDGKVELILINNGSDDGTREYFERLPHAKCINLKYNIFGVNVAQHIIGGRFCVGFSNDVVATPHWLERLLACMESDDRIAMAVPTCNEESIACFQGVPVSYPNTFDGMEEMQAFAAAYNELDPRRWEERSQLMPFLAILRTDLYRIGLLDPIYTRGEFIDDDMSTLLRRTGWRQILMKDTFMHHFGGVTLGAGRNKDAGNALDAMRRVYYEKWGVDAWESRGGFANMDVLWTQQHFRDDDRVLILAPCFGDLACSVVNAYRQHGCVPHMTAAVFDRRYLKDTSYIFDETRMMSCVDDVKEDGQVYEIISTGRYLDELPSDEVISALECLYDCLADGGRLILPVRNPSCADEVISLLYEGGRSLYTGIDEVRRTPVVSYRHLIKALERHEILRHYRMMAVAFQEDGAAAALLREFFSARARLPEDVDRNLSVRMVYLIFEKRGEPAKRMGHS